MTFIDLDTAQFYRPPTRAGWRGDRRVTASNRGVPTAHRECNNPGFLGPSNKLSGRLKNYEPIEYIDFSGPPPMELLDLSCEPAPDRNGAEVHAGGPSNGLHTQGTHGHGGHEEEDEFPSLGELLGFEGAQGSRRGGLSGDSSTSEEQGGTQGSLSTPPTSIADLEASMSKGFSTRSKVRELVTVESGDEEINPPVKRRKLVSSELCQDLCCEAKSPNHASIGVRDQNHNGDVKNDGNIGEPEASKGVTQHVRTSSAEAAPSVPEQPHGQRGAAKDEEQEWDEWEIKQIIGKRERGGCIEYMVQWESTWLPDSQLGKAPRLVQKVEIESKAQRGVPRRSRRVHG